MEERAGINRRLSIEITDSLRKRFWSRVDSSNEDGCWPWKAAMRNGYGAIKHEKRVHSAHRLAYVMTNGEPDDGLVIGHKCDNRDCCNPSHLEAISPGQNNRDARGRLTFHMNRGEDCWGSVLTESVVIEMRNRHKNGESCASIARAFDCGYSTACKAIAGQTWAHVS